MESQNIVEQKFIKAEKEGVNLLLEHIKEIERELVKEYIEWRPSKPKSRFDFIMYDNLTQAIDLFELKVRKFEYGRYNDILINLDKYLALKEIYEKNIQKVGCVYYVSFFTCNTCQISDLTARFYKPLSTTADDKWQYTGVIYAPKYTVDTTSKWIEKKVVYLPFNEESDAIFKW